MIACELNHFEESSGIEERQEGDPGLSPEPPMD